MLDLKWAFKEIPKAIPEMLKEELGSWFD